MGPARRCPLIPNCNEVCTTGAICTTSYLATLSSRSNLPSVYGKNVSTRSDTHGHAQTRSPMHKHAHRLQGNPRTSTNLRYL
eukprot:3630241-Pleurochrysis_carterae.AAC.1